MENTLLISDSLIGSLCRELEYIGKRSKAINSSLANCNDKFLKRRLEEELKNHRARKDELFSISSLFVNKNPGNLSSLFLLELFKRF